MTLRNMTPHSVTLINPDGQELVIPPCGEVVRATSKAVQVGTVDLGTLSVPLVQMEYGEPENVPDYEPGTINIVSSLALSAIHKTFPDRTDFVIPSDSVRDSEGRIIGCKSLGI